jgi:SAM-dependent methyltransferase
MALMADRSPMDWDAGHYEHVAAQLLPAARLVVERAAPTPGERVVDLGCGTGNVALLAAGRGARVIGVDPAPRLLDVARERAAAEGLAATFVHGEAAGLPLDSASADLVLSVFAVIFAPDAVAAAAEMARVTAPGGRVVLTAWIPEGAIAEAGRVAFQAIANALGGPPGPPPFPWHDPDAVAGLLGPHGFAVAVDEERIAFTARSAREYLDAEYANHPMIVSGRAILEPRGEAQAVADRSLAIFEAANEDPQAFRLTSRYLVVTASRA